MAVIKNKSSQQQHNASKVMGGQPFLFIGENESII